MDEATRRAWHKLMDAEIELAIRMAAEEWQYRILKLDNGRYRLSAPGEPGQDIVVLSNVTMKQMARWLLAHTAHGGGPSKSTPAS